MNAILVLRFSVRNFQNEIPPNLRDNTWFSSLCILVALLLYWMNFLHYIYSQSYLPHVSMLYPVYLNNLLNALFPIYKRVSILTYILPAHKHFRINNLLLIYFLPFHHSPRLSILYLQLDSHKAVQSDLTTNHTRFKLWNH